MTDAPHFTCVGVATVDVITSVDHDFIKAHNIVPGASLMVDTHKLGYLLEMAEHPSIVAGGSCANLACGLGQRGLAVDFIGRIGGDSYGALFKNDFAKYRVEFKTPADRDRVTSTCICFNTPDKERSFAFSMGTASWFLKPDDLPDVPDTENEIICIEANTTRMPVGYSPAESVFTAALIKYGHSRRQIFVCLNDREIVSEAQPQMMDALTCPNATMIGNLGELLALFNVHDMAIAFQKAEASGRTFVITNGADGVYLIGPQMMDHVAVAEISADEIVDTIGAGDQFAAGFIAARVKGQDYRASVKEGIEAAAKILKETGGRPAV